MGKRIRNTRLSVVAHGCATVPIRPEAGVPEGGGLSPVTYAVSTAEAADTFAATPGVGIGLDPCPRALHAYHAHCTGVDADLLDGAEVDTWLELAKEGQVGSDVIMASASSDAVRLAILDATCTIVVGLRQYIDDQRAKAASRGQAGLILNTLWNLERHHGGCLRYGPGKSEIVGRFANQ